MLTARQANVQSSTAVPPHVQRYIETQIRGAVGDKKFRVTINCESVGSKDVDGAMKHISNWLLKHGYQVETRKKNGMTNLIIRWGDGVAVASEAFFPPNNPCEEISTRSGR